MKDVELGGELVKGICTIFFMFLFILLAGCSDRTSIKEDVTPVIEELGNNPIDAAKDVGELESQPEQPGAPEEPVAEQPPITINLIDPITEEVITTFSPEELGYLTDYISYENQVKELAKNLARGSDVSEGYDQRMILDKVSENGELLQGNPIIILKESELIEKILSVSLVGGDVELPLYITETGYNRSQFDTLDDVVIASYTTYFDRSVVGRTHNINQSANAISNVIVGINDYFSFNATVGPRTEETGYREALEIVNGEFVLGIGGGICQTSSTLFNAVDQLGVTYVERHHHSKDIGYVPKGRDATVSYGTLDFRFQNITGFPFMIISTTAGDSITVEIRTSQEYANQLN